MFFTDYFEKKRKARSIELEDVTTGGVQNGEEVMALDESINNSGLRFLGVAAVIIFLVLSFRTFQLQILKGDYYGELAKENRIRFVAIKAPRGIIYDRNGKKLVDNVPSFDIILIPADLPRDLAERRNEVRKLAELLSLNDQSLSALVESQDMDSLNPVLIKENISEDESLIFSEEKESFSGFQLDRTAVRNYIDGNYFSSVMGYTGKINKDDLDAHPDYLMIDYIGKNGLEASYERYLRGINGKQKAEVDSMGNIKKDLGIDAPVTGSDLELALDADLQKKIQDELMRILEETKTKTASAVAIDPRTGEVLALVSLPSYDNNLFAKGISQDEYNKLMSDPEKPMFNRAISGEYPPGSTFKPIVAAAALEEGTVDPNTTLNCPAAINIGSYRFPDWKTHGLTDIRKAIAESVDIFFYALGGGWGDVEGLGINKIQKYAVKFGLGRQLGIDIPGEGNGLVPNREWKQEKLGERWYVGDDYHCAIGQGFITATPLQIANYTAAIANGGIVYEPHIAKLIKKNNGTFEEKKPKVLESNFIAPSNIQVVREGMRQTVESGSAQTLKNLKVEVAGKTGTAQYGAEDKTHGWFVSFAPYENPEIAMAIIVEGGGEGYSTAVPVTKNVYDWYFNK